jgi:hypothetical protein
LTGGDGSVSETLLLTGERADPCHTAATPGLTLTEAKAMVAALQQVVVEAQAAEHCAFRRRCTWCGALRPVKDYRPRKLITFAGVGGRNRPVDRRRPCPLGENLPAAFLRDHAWESDGR